MNQTGEPDWQNVEIPRDRWGRRRISEWRDIPGYPGYQASDDGRVRSIDRHVINTLGHRRFLRGQLLAPWPDPDGYLRVAPKQVPIGVHQLVCMAFHGPKPDSQRHAAHRDGNHSNNIPANLYWATPSENERDKVAHGRNPQAAKTECAQGHRYSPENTYITSQGYRHCRACKRDHDRVYAAKAENRERINAANRRYRARKNGVTV